VIHVQTCALCKIRYATKSSSPMRKKDVSPSQAPLLSRYSPIADGIAALCFPYAEVVIHDLRDQRIVHVANNLSRREIGEESLYEDIEFAEGERLIGPYERLNWDGCRMRCVNHVLVDDDGHAIGVMCVSLNISVFEQMRATLDLFITGAGKPMQRSELFRDDWQDRINTFLQGWLAERGLGLNGLTREHRRELVEALYAEGAFRGKSSADYVAAVLNMGRATVYKHLKQLKADG
jgi:D-arginine utilization repressor